MLLTQVMPDFIAEDDGDGSTLEDFLQWAKRLVRAEERRRGRRLDRDWLASRFADAGMEVFSRQKKTFGPVPVDPSVDGFSPTPPKQRGPVERVSYGQDRPERRHGVEDAPSIVLASEDHEDESPTRPTRRTQSPRRRAA